MTRRSASSPGVGLLTVRCAVCRDVTVNAYDVVTLHVVLKKFGWAWLGEHAICHRCLASEDAKVAVTIRRLQGDYRQTQETNDG